MASGRGVEGDSHIESARWESTRGGSRDYSLSLVMAIEESKDEANVSSADETASRGRKNF